MGRDHHYFLAKGKLEAGAGPDFMAWPTVVK
jgi:hypothetical protein